MARARSSGLLIVWTSIVFLAGYAFAQRQIPTTNAGFSEEALSSLDLTNELDSLRGRPLRLRRLTLQPGGVLGLHTHADRPAVGYLLQGQLTYHQEGQPNRVIDPGGSFAEGRSTTHWAESTGSVPAVWIAADIPRP